MDSTLLAALVGTVGGGAATGTGAWVRGRTHARTAARLVYAELTRDSAAVVYFRQTGQWSTPPLSRSAWEKPSPVLARLRRGDVFERASRGYEALDLAAYVAENGFTGADRAELLAEACDNLVTAIEALGAVAQIPKAQIAAWTARLRTGSAANVVGGAGMLPITLMRQVGGPFLPGAPAYVIKGDRLEVRPGAGPRELTPHVVFDAGGRESLEGLRPVRWTGGPEHGDAAVDEVYDALVAVDRFGREVLGIAAADAAREPYAAVVHYGTDYNAHWDAGRFGVFGDGIPGTFTRFTQMEVVATQMWRARPEFEKFPHAGQPGALNISLRDVLGSLTLQYALGQSVDRAAWGVGIDLVVPGRGGQVLRSLKAPGAAYDNDVLGSDPQIAHMDAYEPVDDPGAGPYLHSGIPSHAFYRLAMELGGHAWERAGLIWWDALTGELPDPVPDFATWAAATVRAAAARYGADGDESEAVRAAWEAVGVPLG
ncbi:M4 family metallopeptidase [Streptomyces sp. NPDC052225]|uniref:M4 family metallopeptidase n=1 Tax=Streptomyces sp. NPDC052225 TaxID=3154949 RepID=UPI0034462DD6